MICKKYPYKTRREARATSKFRKEMPFGNPYHCSICGYWHLGHKNKNPKKSAIGKIIRIKMIEKRNIKRLYSLIDT